MKEDLGKEVLERVDTVFAKLAEQAGVAQDHFWPLFVRQQVIEGIWFFSVISVVVIISIGLILWGIRLVKKASEPDSEYSVLFIGVVFLLMCFLSCLINGGDKLSRILNPEYAAVRELMRMIK